MKDFSRNTKKETTRLIIKTVKELKDLEVNFVSTEKVKELILEQLKAHSTTEETKRKAIGSVLKALDKAGYIEKSSKQIAIKKPIPDTIAIHRVVDSLSKKPKDILEASQRDALMQPEFNLDCGGNNTWDFRAVLKMLFNEMVDNLEETALNKMVGKMWNEIKKSDTIPSPKTDVRGCESIQSGGNCDVCCQGGVSNISE